MQTEKKSFYKTLLFWQILIPVVLVIGIGVYIAVELALSVPEPTEPTLITTVPTQTTAATEPTLPPPPENPYGPFDFAMEGDYLTCTAGESVLGIDVSFWQADIDWQKVKEAGVEFSMIRIAWRGS